METLTLLSRHAAIAIENARRYQWEQRRTERLALIARIGHIITADLALDDLLDRAAEAIHELLGYQNVDIPLVHPRDPDTLVVRARGGQYRRAHRARGPAAHRDRASWARPCASGASSS